MEDIKQLEDIVSKEVRNLYGLTNDIEAQLKFFEKLFNLSKEELNGAGKHELDAMALTVMYRHLDSKAREKAMGIIRSVPNRRLNRSLFIKTVDTTFVNSSWGTWSKSTEELKKDLFINKSIKWVEENLGAKTVSALFAIDVYKNEIGVGKAFKKSTIATIALYVYFSANNLALKNNESEILRRQVLQQNPRTSNLFPQKEE